ncbi:MAG: Eco57I restriction-modification methylase domain-containing protein [Candidatus Binataceae bacterium]
MQRKLDGGKTQKERNRLGQFATPAVLASDMLEYARALLPDATALRFLDPAIGTGAFYSALLRHFPAEIINAAVGVEIDTHYGAPARRLWSGHALKIEIADFTLMKAPAANGRFNLIVCNPPYVRHHHISVAEKNRLPVATASACGIKMAGLSGLYCYFLGLAHAWLAPDGLAGWLIPSEFMDVNYGATLKHYLLNEVELLHVHRFDPNDLQFGDALVSSAVVWFRKRRPDPEQQVRLSYGGTLSRPLESRLVRAGALVKERKWAYLASSDARVPNRGPRLGDFFSIKRGLATGDNRFFLLSKQEIDAYGLPGEFFKPILPGPRHLPSDLIEAEADGTPKIERQRFILDCRLPEDLVRRKYRALWDYLQTGKPRVSDTYLCSRRNPWYAQENRPPAPFVCTYMGRDLASRAKPFRFIWNRSQATAANVYLLLYPVPELTRFLERDPKNPRSIWEFLNSIPIGILLGEGRVYGGGLYKLEPRELAHVPADGISAIVPEFRRPARQREMFPGHAS